MPVIRLLGSEFADPATVLAGLDGLPSRSRPDMTGSTRPRRANRAFPAGERALRLDRRLARRILEAQEAWLDEVRDELRGS